MLEGSWAGITVYGSPKNFRLSWVHARDYGLVAMNPFGLNTFTKAPRQDIVIKQGDVMKLEYAVTVHETAVREDYDAKSASPYRD